MSKKIRIITHNGGFHSDDVFAVATLKVWLGRTDAKKFFGETKPRVIRTRNLDVIKGGDFVVDIGGEYEPRKLKFDHHQPGGAGERPNGIPYAAVGLVWKEYGEKSCGSSEVASEIDKRLVQPIDALDNGLDIYEPTHLGARPYLLTDIIDIYNFISKKRGENLYDNFLEMVSFAEKLLEREIEKIRATAAEKKFVEEIYQRTKDKRILVLGNGHDTNAWQKVLEKYPEPVYIVREARERGVWEIRTVKKNGDFFESRKDLPQEWAGKVDDELARITEVKDAIFCHNKRFIAVAKSREGAIELARLALE